MRPRYSSCSFTLYVVASCTLAHCWYGPFVASRGINELPQTFKCHSWVSRVLVKAHLHSCQSAKSGRWTRGQEQLGALVFGLAPFVRVYSIWSRLVYQMRLLHSDPQCCCNNVIRVPSGPLVCCLSGVLNPSIHSTWLWCGWAHTLPSVTLLRACFFQPFSETCSALGLTGICDF